MTTTYAGFNDVHLTEKLREVHQLAVSRSSVRSLRLALGRPATRLAVGPACGFPSALDSREGSRSYLDAFAIRVLAGTPAPAW